MMKITKAVSAALLAATALAGTSAALAAQDPLLTPTDLYVAVWNPGTNISVFQDLGTSYSSLTSATTFQNPSGYSTTWTVDGGNLATDLGAGTYQYSLFAGDDSGTSNYIGESQMMGIVQGKAAPTLQNGAIIDTSLLGTMRPYLVNKMTLPVSTYVGNTGNGGYWAACVANPGCNGGSFGMSQYNNLGAQTTGGNLNLVRYVGQGPNDVSTNNTVNSLIGNANGPGVFTLNGSTLSYALSGASAVPLPAAVWLLISGLLGLGAVSRRRDGSAGSLAV